MQKKVFIDILNEIERKGLKACNASFKCGIHISEETQKFRREKETEFCDAISDLRKVIISEGVN